MKFLFPILLFALVASQVELYTFLKHHPINVNNQFIHKEDYYQLMCTEDASILLDTGFDIEGKLLPEFIKLNFNNILNPNNYFIEIDSVYLRVDFLFEMEHKENKFYSRFYICEDKMILDDYFIWGKKDKLLLNKTSRFHEELQVAVRHTI